MNFASERACLVPVEHPEQAERWQKRTATHMQSQLLQGRCVFPWRTLRRIIWRIFRRIFWRISAAGFGAIFRRIFPWILLGCGFLWTTFSNSLQHCVFTTVLWVQRSNPATVPPPNPPDSWSGSEACHHASAKKYAALLILLCLFSHQLTRCSRATQSCGA